MSFFKRHDIKIKEYTKWMMVLDRLMSPLMWLAGSTLDSLQQTHAWHVQKIPAHLLASAKWDLISNTSSKIVIAIGNEETWMNKKQKGIFHIPILGGWKNYIVLAPTMSVEKISPSGWRIGWYSVGPRPGLEINAIPLYGPVKMLIGSPDFKTTFFGVNADTYEQIDIVEIGSGTNGDMKYPTIPLL